MNIPHQLLVALSYNSIMLPTSIYIIIHIVLPFSHFILRLGEAVSVIMALQLPHIPTYPYRHTASPDAALYEAISCVGPYVTYGQQRYHSANARCA
jgi:hypothetical protein